MVSLWQGQRWLRWLMAGWSFIHAATIAAVIALLVYHLSLETPPEKAGAFLKVLSALFAWPLIETALYLFVGLSLLLSPSLRAFCEYQSRTANSPWLELLDRILRLFQRNEAMPEEDSFWTRYKNRPRFPILTRDILRSLDDWDLTDAVVDYVRIKIECSDKDDVEIVSALPRGFQAVYSTWWVRAEVDNGGFHQYFYNQGINWAFMALEGYKLIGATELAGLMARAIELFLEEESEQLSYRTPDLSRMLEQYVEARNASALPELDNLFYRIEGDDGVTEYIRTHLDEFIAN
ncbi:MAG TPA: DUF4375 domain-containing protein [Pirellulaceae bacterium]|nr:DUF4375 domain-containing protein [Pirellulaceae bacterium]